MVQFLNAYLKKKNKYVSSANITSYITCVNNDIYVNYKRFLIPGIAKHNIGMFVPQFGYSIGSFNVESLDIICNYDDSRQIVRFLMFCEIYGEKTNKKYNVHLFTKCIFIETINTICNSFNNRGKINVNIAKSMPQSDYIIFLKKSNAVVGTRGDADSTIGELFATQKFILFATRYDAIFGYTYKETLMQQYFSRLFEENDDKQWKNLVIDYNSLTNFISCPPSPHTDMNDDSSVTSFIQSSLADNTNTNTKFYSMQSSRNDTYDEIFNFVNVSTSIINVLNNDTHIIKIQKAINNILRNPHFSSNVLKCADGIISDKVGSGNINI